jgi:membrane-associated phospholipid phosphatase
MDVRTVERLTAGLAVCGLVAVIGLQLRRDRPHRAERVTVGSLISSAASVSPVTASLWARTAPARAWVEAHTPRGLADVGVASGLAVVVASAWLAVGLLEDVATNDAIVGYDVALGNAIERWRHPWAVRTAEWLSEASSPGGNSLLAVGVIAVLFKLGRRVEALGFVAAAAGTALWTGLVKELLGRDRPSGVDLYHPVGHSFPSGHTSGTAAVYAYLAWLVTRHESNAARVAAVAGAAVITAIVASCRVYLAVHWLSDVLGGALLGVGWTTACILETRRVLRAQARRVAEGVAETD